MPFVQRNRKGEVTGLFLNRQQGGDDEELGDEHPDVIAFRAAHPTPDGMLRPLSEKERRRIEEESERIEREHQDLHKAIWRFNAAFLEVETALSALLYAALHISPCHSQIAYAIYYSPSGFEARTAIINNVIEQLAMENTPLKPLRKPWSQIFAEIQTVRAMRNKVAHGMPITLAIRGQRHVRLTSPPFDANRVGRLIGKGSVPGTSASQILEAAKKARWLVNRVDEVNILLTTFHEPGNPRLKEEFTKLSKGLDSK